MEDSIQTNFIQQLFKNKTFKHLFHLEIAHQTQNQTHLWKPGNVTNIYDSIGSIMRITIKEAVSEIDSKCMQHNQQIMDQIAELRVIIGDINKNKSDLLKFSSSSQIKIDNFMEESLITEASPYVSVDIIKIREDLQTLKGTMSQIISSNLEIKEERSQSASNFIPQIHSKIFENITIKSPLRKRIHTSSQIANSSKQIVAIKEFFENRLQSTMRQNIKLKEKLNVYQCRGLPNYEGRFNNISSTLTRIQKDLNDFKRSSSSDINHTCETKTSKRSNFASKLNWK